MSMVENLKQAFMQLRQQDRTEFTRWLKRQSPPQAAPSDERSLYSQRLHAWVAFDEACKSCEFLLEHNIGPQDDLYRPLLLAVSVDYMRSFMQCNGLGRLTADLVPEEFSAIHETLRQLRHCHFAHVDAECYIGSADELINEVGVEIEHKPSGIALHPNPRTPVLGADFLRATLKLCEFLKGVLYENLSRFQKDHLIPYIRQNHLKSGLYTINLDRRAPNVLLKLAAATVSLQHEGRQKRLS